YHHFGTPVLDPAHRLADGVGTGRTSAGVSERGSTKTMLDRNLTSGHVRDQRRNQIGANASGPLVFKNKATRLKGLKPTHAHSNEDANAVSLFLRQLKLSIEKGHLGRGQSEGDEARALLHLLLLHVISRIETLHLGGDARCEAFIRIKERDRTGAAPPGQNGR